MVSILPAARTPFDVLGAEVGRSLQSVLPGAVQQGYQRGLGLNAIDQLQADLAASGGDVSKMIPAIAKAYTLNPALERSGIAEKLIPLAQRKAGAEEFPTGKGRIPTRAIEGQEKEVPISVSDLVKARPSLIQDPSGVSNFQLPYGPEDIANIRQQARQRNYTPEMEERFVADALEYNKIAQTKRDVEIANYNQQQKQRQDTLENQVLFEKYLVEHSPEFATNPDERELALKASQKYQNEPSFAERNAKVKEELRPYQAAKNALKKTLSRPLFGQTKEQRELSRPRAKFMVEMGQKPQLQLMIANGGSGEAEEADLLNPLPENIENTFKTGFPTFINPLDEVKDVDPDSPNFEKMLNFGREKRQKQNERMVDYLSDIITPGTYNNPGTNLLLLRKNIMDKNSDWIEAAKMIDSAISRSGIKLDPQQKIDYQKLAYPPLTGETYLDTILNNVLFPITGRQ